MNFPEQLKNISYPNFQTEGDILFIYNLPFTDEIMFSCFAFLFFLYVLSGKEVPDIYNYPILFFILFLLIAYSTFSEDKVTIDFSKKLIQIKNYNPIQNFMRKHILQLPSIIPFRNIDHIISDQTYFRKDGNKYYVYIITDVPYKLKIAEFSNSSDADFFLDFMKANIHKR